MTTNFTNRENIFINAYTHIFYKHSEERWMDFLFYNSNDKTGLFYDGVQIDFIKTIREVPGTFQEMNKSLLSFPENNIVIEGIRKRHSISYIKFEGGDILSTYFMESTEDSFQNAQIYKMNQPGYEFILSGYEEALAPKINFLEDDRDII